MSGTRLMRMTILSSSIIRGSRPSLTLVSLKRRSQTTTSVVSTYSKTKSYWVQGTTNSTTNTNKQSPSSQNTQTLSKSASSVRMGLCLLQGQWKTPSVSTRLVLRNWNTRSMGLVRRSGLLIGIRRGKWFFQEELMDPSGYIMDRVPSSWLLSKATNPLFPTVSSLMTERR